MKDKTPTFAAKKISKMLKTKENSPEEIIIQHIRQRMIDGELSPGMRLPAERKMAEQFGVGRIHVRQALKQLETYGIIKTMPQSGSVIMGLDISAIDGLLSDFLQLNSFDFAALAEMRVVLEVNAARFCAERRTKRDLQRLTDALDNYINTYNNPESDPDEVSAADFAFHRCISEGAHNSVLHSMLLLITPDIMTIYRNQKICNTSNPHTFEEHLKLMEYIEQRKGARAAALMKEHLSGVLVYAHQLRRQQKKVDITDAEEDVQEQL
ncbi:MAG: FadR family transcriptional regulator [Paludibacteraceae bacterium]|nr:FadR family transcriptional regulator [Paludibacteraceae bacterium]